MKGDNLRDPVQLQKVLEARRVVERARTAAIIASGVKWCPKCKQTLPHDSFSPSKTAPTGLTNRCKLCACAVSKAYWRKKHPVPVIELHNKRVEAILAGGEKICEKCKLLLPLDQFHKSNVNRFGCASHCKACRSAAAKATNANKSEEEKHGAYLTHRDERLAYERDRRKDPETRVKIAAAKYVYMHKPEVRARRNARTSERYQTDVNFRLTTNIRARIKMALKAHKRSGGRGVVLQGSKLGLLGCTITDYAEYLAKQFEPGMSWANHGEWHIDHIKPVCTFDLSDDAQLREAFHYTNTRPLWAAENLSRPKNKLVIMAGTGYDADVLKVGD